MIPSGERWHYLAVKKLSALLRGITSKHDGDFYCLNCLHFLATKNKRESHKKVWENKDFCSLVMPSKDTKILEFSQNQKSDIKPFITCGDCECLIEQINGCKTNHENSPTTKVNEHVGPGFSMSTISSFKSIEKKHDVYRDKECRKKLQWRSLILERKNEVINKRTGRIF